MDKYDMTGRRFGKLVVRARLHRGKYGWFWLCDCDCGNTTEALTSRLLRGKKTSCGCMRKERARQIRRFGSDHSGWKGHGGISGAHWSRIKASAEKRRVEFDVTIEEAWNLFIAQDGICFLSGEPLYIAASQKELSGGANTASLDRIDSNKGYVLGNLQWVHVDVNYMKQWFEQDKFISWCRKIISHQNSARP